MIKTKKLPFIVIGFSLLLLFSSCKPKNTVYEKHKALSPDVEWKKEDIREFKVPVENADIEYKLKVGFRYVHGYPFKTCKIRIEEISPSGDIVTYQKSLEVRKDNGDYIGDAGYDIWDSTHLIAEGKTYGEAGTYRYRIEHEMNMDPLPYAMEIGLILEKDEKDNKKKKKRRNK